MLKLFFFFNLGFMLVVAFKHFTLLKFLYNPCDFSAKARQFQNKTDSSRLFVVLIILFRDTPRICEIFLCFSGMGEGRMSFVMNLLSPRLSLLRNLGWGWGCGGSLKPRDVAT